MNIRKGNGKRENSIDERIFKAKILEKAEKTRRNYVTTFTDFLDPSRRSIAIKILDAETDNNYYFTGGYKGAEREIAVFSPDFVCSDIYNCDLLRVLKIYFKGGEKISHRDYLGALMGLGIKREKIGDILVGENTCDIVVLKEIADYIKYNLEKVGNVRVETSVSQTSDLEIREDEYEEVTATVASMRLDCILSSGFNLSRSKALEAIKAQRAYLNWEIAEDAKRQVHEGDTITIRGKGRIILQKVNGKTRKDRISVLLRKFA